MEGQPLLGVLRGLILDDGEQAEFNADPSGYMQRAGYDDISEEDLGEAVSLVADTLPPDVAHAVNTAAAPPDGAEDDGGALGMLGRLAEIDTDQIAPLEVPEPMADYAPDDGLGWAVEDDSASSFGDVDQGFDDIDPFAEEAAEPDFEEGDQVPFSQIHNVDDDPVDVDVDVDAGHGDPEAAEDEAIDFGEGSTAPDVADDGAGAGDTAGIEGGLAGAFNSAADAAAGPEGGGGELGDDAFGSDTTFDESGDTGSLDDADAYDDGYPYDYSGDTGEEPLDDADHAPDVGDDDVGLF
jgi:hypothetical protein